MTARRHNPGFTLIEMIAAIVVIGTISSIGAGLVYSGVEAARAGRASAQLHDDLSGAMEVIAREVRMIPRDTSGNLTITTAADNSVQLADGRVFTRSGTDLQVTISGVAATQLERVTDLQFRYFDNVGSELARPVTGASIQLIHRISVSITAEAASRGRGNSVLSETLQTQVFLRERMRP
jgi:prepilin-type N-terminal cleavage/methylation domain-containing protein